jgi:hypothetical protein
MKVVTKILDVLLTLFFIVTSVLCGDELFSYFMKSSEYGFGSEGGGWFYRSSVNYVGSILGLLVISISGVLLGMAIKDRAMFFSVRCGFFIVVVAAFSYGYLSVH